MNEWLPADSASAWQHSTCWLQILALVILICWLHTAFDTQMQVPCRRVDIFLFLPSDFFSVSPPPKHLVVVVRTAKHLAGIKPTDMSLCCNTNILCLWHQPPSFILPPCNSLSFPPRAAASSFTHRMVKVAQCRLWFFPGDSGDFIPTYWSQGVCDVSEQLNVWAR